MTNVQHKATVMCKMLKAQIIFAILLVNLQARISGAQSLDTIDFGMVQELTKKIGEELWNVGNAITKRSEIQESFSQARIVNKSGTRLVDDIAKDLKAMLDVRINAVKRIVKTAEELPKVYENTTNFENYTFTHTRTRDKFRKELLRLKAIDDEKLEKLSQDKNYTKKRKPIDESPICYKRSHPDDDDGNDQPDHGCMAKFNETIDLKSKEASIFLPLDVFDKDGNLTRIIHRSKGLDKAFFANYKLDPTIAWQYFCNSTGMFRHFPATNWSFYPINMYDCRMRHWFTGAAASSKDILILIERSGSMLRKRMQIAVDVVRNILDTLTPNDYFNVLHFNEAAEFLTKCAQGLVQATSSNVFDIKRNLEEIEPRGQTDLAEALTLAFDILSNHTETSSNCNQVIMLITDGMEYNETIQKIFREYNWERGNNVRVFSYLIGEQIPEGDYEQVKLMACENRGYYTQIDTTKETREQALKYIPIMARPLALSNQQSPVVWTNVYVDIIDPIRTTNYDWNCKQSEVQRERVVNYLYEYDWYPCIQMNDPEESDPKYRKFVFMTTVSMPAYERGVNASLMGVAAIDVPLFEFERLFQNYRTGVGGYTFIIDQNGNILTHPDFRPFFQGKVLKPSYNDVDMAEVELMDDSWSARNFSNFLLDFRESIIDKTSGSKYMFALQPYDDMRRVFQLKRNYFWKKINQTPFTVVTTFPEHFIGRVQIPEGEIDSMFTKGSNLAILFKEENGFKIHPDWIYCRGIRKGFEDLKLGLIDPDNCEMSPEDELVFYLEKFEKSGWKWKQDKLDSNDTQCDRKLMQLLIFDGKVTENFPAEFSKRSKEMSFIEKFHIKTSFISTHSGLFRYKTFDKKIHGDKFAEKMKRSIDEIWYRHAVEYNKNEPQSFVYSVPFNAYEQQEPRITATHTIFIRDGSEKVPIAVVGYQFAHSKLEEVLEQYCPQNKEELCYILDDNAYILSDPDAEHTGKFFGAVENKLMKILIDDHVFERNEVFDYQAVCYEDRLVDYEHLMKRNSALSVFLWNPFKYFAALFATLISTVYAVPAYMANLMYSDSEHFYDESVHHSFFCNNIHEQKFMDCLVKYEVKSNDSNNHGYLECLKKKEERYKKCIEENGAQFILKRHFNRTRPRKCDKSNVVYSLTKDESNFLRPYDECSRPFVVQRVAHSNLILLITNRNCAQVFAAETDFKEVPKTVMFESSVFCHKYNKTLFRNRPKSCMTHHVQEPKFDPKNLDRSQCGRGHKLKIHNLITIFLLIIPLLKMMPVLI